MTAQQMLAALLEEYQTVELTAWGDSACTASSTHLDEKPHGEGDGDDAQAVFEAIYGCYRDAFERDDVLAEEGETDG